MSGVAVGGLLIEVGWAIPSRVGLWRLMTPCPPCSLCYCLIDGRASLLCAAANAPAGVSDGLVRAIKSLDRAVADYRQRTGKAPVLVLDNIERMSKRAPEALRFLQEVAQVRDERGPCSTSSKSKPAMQA